MAYAVAHLGYCLCCRRERADLATQRQAHLQICSVCTHHQDDDRADWGRRDQHHRAMWEGQLVEAEDAYLDELSTLEREVGRLKGILADAGISSVRTDPNALALARIHELHARNITTSETVANILNEEGYKPPPRSDRWSGRMVNQLAGRTATSLVIEGAGKMVTAL